MENPNSQEKVIGLLKQKQQLLESILQLLKRQTTAISADDEVGLLKIIDKKSELIVSLQTVDRELEALVEGLSDEKMELLAREAGDLINHLEASFEELSLVEESCRQKLQEKKSQVQDKVMGLKQGKSLLKGYKTKPRKGPNISENI
jgi:hypothetical protein